MSFRLRQLPYDDSALEPHFDEEWIAGQRRRQEVYARQLEDLLAGTEWADVHVEALLLRLQELPEELRGPVAENAGGHLNHALLFAGIGPDGGGEPGYELLDDIERDFGSFPGLQKAVASASASLAGEGWVWLVWNGRTLELVPTELERNPLDRHRRPLLGIDLWEHAHERLFADRASYVEALWHVVDWRVVAERFLEAEEVSRGGPGVGG
jgi:Fe-Mn family superoxide dismutase